MYNLLIHEICKMLCRTSVLAEDSNAIRRSDVNGSRFALKKDLFLNILFFTGVRASEAWRPRRPISGGAGIAILHRVTACGTPSHPSWAFPAYKGVSLTSRGASYTYKGPPLPTEGLPYLQRGVLYLQWSLLYLQRPHIPKKAASYTHRGASYA